MSGVSYLCRRQFLPQAVYAAGNSRAEGTIYVRRTIYETKFQFIPAERFGFSASRINSEKFGSGMNCRCAA